MKYASHVSGILIQETTLSTPNGLYSSQLIRKFTVEHFEITTYPGRLCDSCFCT